MADNDKACDASKEPLEVKLIAVAADGGLVRITPEKCDRIKCLLKEHDALLVAAAYEDVVRLCQSNYPHGAYRSPDVIQRDIRMRTSADAQQAWERHDEEQRRKFSVECQRFHESGNQCMTCGRQDMECKLAEARLDEHQKHPPCECFWAIGEPRKCKRCAKLEEEIKNVAR